MIKKRLNPHIEALVREFADWWATRGRELDAANEVREHLYRYTTVAALLGIVSNEEYGSEASCT